MLGLKQIRNGVPTRASDSSRLVEITRYATRKDWTKEPTWQSKTVELHPDEFQVARVTSHQEPLEVTFRAGRHLRKLFRLNDVLKLDLGIEFLITHVPRNRRTEEFSGLLLYDNVRTRALTFQLAEGEWVKE